MLVDGIKVHLFFINNHPPTLLYSPKIITTYIKLNQFIYWMRLFKKGR